MKINEMSFEEFIEIFDVYFEDFILRVRDSKQDYDKKNGNENLVYYNGIEAFTVKRNGNGIQLDFPKNVYKLNPTGLKNASKNNNDEEVLIDGRIEDLEEGQTINQKEANYRTDIGNICNAMHSLFDFAMDKIIFYINFNDYEIKVKNKKNKSKIITKEAIIKKFYNSILRDFANAVKSHNRDKKTRNLDYCMFKITNNENDYIIYSNTTEEEFNNICKDFSDKVKFTLEFTPKLSTKKDEYNSTPKDIITLQCHFLKETRNIGRVSGVSFNVNSYYIGKSYKTKDALEKFSNNTKNAIEKYKSTSCKKLEKSYQHFFMLRAYDMKDLFHKKEDEYIDYFEQEYGIYNPKVYGLDNSSENQKKDKTGRIDCIVYKYKLDGKKRLITDVYMIELKVNCDVILGNNGVMTHLEDINAFLQFKDTGSYQYYDYDRLEKRINDRIKILSGGKEEAKFENVTKHFYTVIGYTNESMKTIIIDMLKKLNDKNSVLEMINRGYSTIIDGKSKIFKLNVRFAGITLQDLKQNIKDCDVKFFLEDLKSEKFNKEDIGLQFKDVTNDIFKIS